MCMMWVWNDFMTGGGWLDGCKCFGQGGRHLFLLCVFVSSSKACNTIKTLYIIDVHNIFYCCSKDICYFIWFFVHYLSILADRTKIQRFFQKFQSMESKRRPTTDVLFLWFPDINKSNWNDLGLVLNQCEPFCG